MIRLLCRCAAVPANEAYIKGGGGVGILTVSKILVIL